MIVVPLPMPKSCDECDFCTYDMECRLLDFKSIDVTKLSECPLKEYKGE